MKRTALMTIVILGIVALTTGSLAATPGPTIAQQLATAQATLAKSKQTNRALRARLADQQDVITTQDATLADQADTIARLRDHIANQPDPLDVITSRDEDGLWAAAQAIWRVFPTLPVGSLCGYDKSSTQNDGLTPASLSLYRYTNC